MSRAPARLEPDHAAVFLDVDGTLLEICDHPDDVLASDDLKGLLRALVDAHSGALALVSGRTIEAIDAIFSDARLPACGAHGAEIRLADGELRLADGHYLPGETIARLQSFVDSNDGLLLERKPGGVSLHYRKAPHLEHACRELVHSILDGLSSEFRIIDGKMVLELAPLRANKGDAIRQVMHEAPYAGRRPVFVGDDVTDEDGFRAVNALGGVSVRVGGCNKSEADFELADVPAVHDWLRSATGGYQV